MMNLYIGKSDIEDLPNNNEGPISRSGCFSNDTHERQKRQLWDLLTLPAQIAPGTANLAIEAGNGVSRGKPLSHLI